MRTFARIPTLACGKESRRMTMLHASNELRNALCPRLHLTIKRIAVIRTRSNFRGLSNRETHKYNVTRLIIKKKRKKTFRDFKNCLFTSQLRDIVSIHTFLMKGFLRHDDKEEQTAKQTRGVNEQLVHSSLYVISYQICEIIKSR